MDLLSAALASDESVPTQRESGSWTTRSLRIEWREQLVAVAVSGGVAGP
jgi:hypothetical protein